MSAVELSPEALLWLQKNVATHSDALIAQPSSVRVIEGDAVTEPLRHAQSRSADLVVTNPPYIPDGATPIEPEVTHYDPPMALYGGADGLDIVRALAGTAVWLLKPGGMFMVEHADVQGEDASAGVPALLRAACDDNGTPLWAEVRDYRDLAGKPRVTTAVRAGEPA
jgi:release factor glutamine methyltransferase